MSLSVFIVLPFHRPSEIHNNCVQVLIFFKVLLPESLWRILV